MAENVYVSFMNFRISAWVWIADRSAAARTITRWCVSWVVLVCRGDRELGACTYIDMLDGEVMLERAGRVGLACGVCDRACTSHSQIQILTYAREKHAEFDIYTEVVVRGGD